MRPAGSDGKTVLSTSPFSPGRGCPALTTPAPKPRHGSSDQTKGLMIGPGIASTKRHPAYFQHTFLDFFIDKEFQTYYEWA
jgi:hypothetical protein